MTNWLVKIFVKNYEKTEKQSVRAAYGKFASIVGILCNVLLFAVKLGVGIISGSVAVSADAVNNLSDASSNIVSFFGFQLAAKPADEGHPYGHGRYEYLSGLMVAVFIMIIGAELLENSVKKILHPEEVVFDLTMGMVLFFTILLKLWMMNFNRKTGKIINSKTLEATAADSRNDAVTTAVVLAGVVISHLTGIHLDGYMGAAVAIFILVSGFGIVRDTIDPLLGKAPAEEQVENIREKILSYPGVLGTHDLMVHDYGPGRQFASVHVEMSAEMGALACHEVIDTMERDFMENDGLHMVIHYDPISSEDTEENRMRLWLSEKVQEIDEGISIHDFRICESSKDWECSRPEREGAGNEEDDRKCLCFDCALPENFFISDEEIKKAVTELAREKYPNCRCDITVDRSYAAVGR